LKGKGNKRNQLPKGRYSTESIKPPPGHKQFEKKMDRYPGSRSKTKGGKLWTPKDEHVPQTQYTGGEKKCKKIKNQLCPSKRRKRVWKNRTLGKHRQLAFLQNARDWEGKKFLNL